MNIPESSLEPFGYIGIPTLCDIETIDDKILLAVDEELHDPDKRWMGASLMGLNLQVTMLEIGNKWLDWVDVNYNDSWENGLVTFEARYKFKGRKPRTVHGGYYPQYF